MYELGEGDPETRLRHDSKFGLVRPRVLSFSGVDHPSNRGEIMVPVQCQSQGVTLPARSNEFQRLILVIERALSGTNTTVKESFMFADPVTGEDREIDIALLASIGKHQVVVAVETRDRTRKADVTWIDELIGKYQNTGFSIVAISKNGFTKNASLKAKVLGIEAISLVDAERKDWPAIFRNARLTVISAATSHLQARFRVPDTFRGSWITGGDRAQYDNAEIVVEGKSKPVHEIIDDLADLVDFADMALDGRINEEGKVQVGFNMPHGSKVTKPGEPDIPIARIDIRMDADISDSSNIELVGSKLGEELIIHGFAEHEGHELHVVAVVVDQDGPLLKFSVTERPAG